jgi:hypothetical protein
MNSNIKDNLILIKEVAERALEEHKNSTERFGGVNYGDLGFVDVWVKYSMHEEELEYGVLIEEVSPTAYELQDYMVEYLEYNLGFPVNVETEW